MVKLVKEEGRMEKCPSCKQSMVCNMTTGEHAKLQWQNEDGKSHYMFDQATNAVTCRGITSGETSTPQPNPDVKHKTNWSILDDKSQGQITLQDGFKGMRSLAYEIVKDEYPEMNDQSDKFGTIVNATIGHLIQMATITAIREKPKNA